MKSKFIKKLSQKIGLPPGTIFHVGNGKQRESRLSVIDFNKNKFVYKKEATLQEAVVLIGRKSTTWVNIDGLEQPELIEAIDKAFGIHDLVAEDIVNTGHRPKLEDHGEYLFIIMKLLTWSEKDAEIICDQISIVVGSSYVLTFQEHKGEMFNPVRERIKQSKGRVRNLGADYLAYVLIDTIVDNYYLVLDGLGEKIEILEDQLMKEAKPQMTKEIHQYKRDMIFLRKQIWPLREVVNGLLRNESKLIGEDIGIFLRDVYDHTIQVVDTIESYRDMLSGMQDIYLSSMSNKMNEVMKVLTVFAVIFIPLTFIAGIYGMNFKNMPELDSQMGYYYVLGAMAFVTSLMLIFFKRKGWI